MKQHLMKKLHSYWTESGEKKNIQLKSARDFFYYISFFADRRKSESVCKRNEKNKNIIRS